MSWSGARPTGDRYRAVLLAMDDDPELEGDQIALRLGRSPRFVDEWVGRYRRGGLAALRPKPDHPAAGAATEGATRRPA